jgi:dephospho-CoA kinase
MISIAVTGGLGSGKSTVVELLAARGAETIVADALARAALDRGSEGYVAAVARFGRGILDPDGAIDRAALGRIVFADTQALRDLEAIVHPSVQEAIRRRMLELDGSDAVVVLELPLFVESGGRDHHQVDGVLVVDTPIDLAIERVERDRGISAEDARARISAQADPAERLRIADFIIMNHGTRHELELMVDGAWEWIGRLKAEHQR